MWDATFERLLRRRLPGLGPDEGVRGDVPLAALGLNSIGTVALIAELEEEYEVIFPDSMLLPRNFRTPAAIWTTLTSVIGETVPSPGRVAR